MYIPVCTGIYLSVLVHTSTSMYLYIPVHTSMHWYVRVCTGMYWYVLVCTSTYSYVLLCTGVFHSFLQCYSLSDGLWCMQDTIIVIPPYPYSVAEEIDDVPFEHRLLVCTPPALLPVPPASYWRTAAQEPVVQNWP